MSDHFLVLVHPDCPGKRVVKTVIFQKLVYENLKCMSCAKSSWLCYIDINKKGLVMQCICRIKTSLSF